MELCSRSCASWVGEESWERMDTCICEAECLHCSPKIITLLIGYIPIQNKVFLKKDYRDRRSTPRLEDQLTWDPTHTLILSANPSWNRKTHQTLWVGTHGFSRQESAVLPFVWQSNKDILFSIPVQSLSYVQLFVTPRTASGLSKTVSEIQFSTGVLRSWAFSNTNASILDMLDSFHTFDFQNCKSSKILSVWKCVIAAMCN